ncbi:unnamed protein product [Cyclocybe aegerita]|uniref:Uncharacterized protein n=1 Tax=Cyclocybe aegerita TaxID=1973307 RepID=A0A8S0XNN2_CYCAE|nr:unnamed protein product [Cyclocybe aegerita]
MYHVFNFFFFFFWNLKGHGPLFHTIPSIRQAHILSPHMPNDLVGQTERPVGHAHQRGVFSHHKDILPSAATLPVLISEREMPPLSVDAYHNGGSILQAFLYGLYLVSFFQALSSLLVDPSVSPHRWRKREHIRRLTLSVCLLLFLNATISLCLSIVRAVYLAQNEIANWLHVLRGVNNTIQILLADGILIYRLWVVSAMDRRFVAFPLLLWVASLCSSAAALASQAQSSLSQPSTTSTVMYYTWATTWCLTAALNIYCTSFIAFIVWKVIKTASRLRAGTSEASAGENPTLLSVVMVVVESCLLYTIASIIACISTLTRGDFIFITAPVKDAGGDAGAVRVAMVLHVDGAPLMLARSCSLRARHGFQAVVSDGIAPGAKGGTPKRWFGSMGVSRSDINEKTRHDGL